MVSIHRNRLLIIPGKRIVELDNIPPQHEQLQMIKRQLKLRSPSHTQHHSPYTTPSLVACGPACGVWHGAAWRL